MISFEYNVCGFQCLLPVVFLKDRSALQCYRQQVLASSQGSLQTLRCFHFDAFNLDFLKHEVEPYLCLILFVTKKWF